MCSWPARLIHPQLCTEQPGEPGLCPRCTPGLCTPHRALAENEQANTREVLCRAWHSKSSMKVSFLHLFSRGTPGSPGPLGPGAAGPDSEPSAPSVALMWKKPPPPVFPWNPALLCPVLLTPRLSGQGALAPTTEDPHWDPL